MWTHLHNWVWERSLWESGNDGQEESCHPGDSKCDPKQKGFKAPFNFCVINKTALAVHGQISGFMYVYVWASLCVWCTKGVYVYLYTPMWVCIYVCTCVLCMGVYACIWSTCIYLCIYVFVYLWVCVCISVLVYMYTFYGMCACVFMHACGMSRFCVSVSVYVWCFVCICLYMCVVPICVFGVYMCVRLCVIWECMFVCSCMRCVYVNTCMCVCGVCSVSVLCVYEWCVLIYEWCVHMWVTCEWGVCVCMWVAWVGCESVTRVCDTSVCVMYISGVCARVYEWRLSGMYSRVQARTLCCALHDASRTACVQEIARWHCIACLRTRFDGLTGDHRHVIHKSQVTRVKKGAVGFTRQ